MTDRTAAPYTPCWTELAVPDPEAAKAFYAAVFGWSAETDPRPETGGYTVFKLDGEPVAAVSPPFPETRPTSWNVCLAVQDADATAAKAEQNGGRILMQPDDVLDLGRYAVIADAAGAAFALWQAKAFAGSTVIGRPNALGWVELATTDPTGALAFYPAIFGWATHLSDLYTEWSLDGVHFGGMSDLNQLPGDGAPAWIPYFRVTDVVDAAERASGAGATVVVPPADVPGGDVRVSVLKDPQGADFGLFAPAG